LLAVDARKRVEAALFLAMFLGLTLVAAKPALGASASSGFAPICITHAIVVPVPFSICVIQFGVQESGGTTTWLPGYGYPGTPISQCQNKTELAQDALGRTIVLHQFILNGTAYMIESVCSPAP
jgi:hypothetical protein